MKYLVIAFILFIPLNLTGQRFDKTHKIKITGIDSLDSYYLFHFRNYRRESSTVRMNMTDDRVLIMKSAIRTRKKVKIKLVRIHEFRGENGFSIRSNRTFIGPIYFVDGKFKMHYQIPPLILSDEHVRFVYGVD